MSYNQMIQRKSYTLALILFLSIILRAIVNGIYIGMASVVPYFLGAIVITGFLLLMVRFVHPVAMMFVMVGFLSAFTMVLMVAFPDQSLITECKYRGSQSWRGWTWIRCCR